LAIVFKKQEISQQVLIHNFYFIPFLVTTTNNGATVAEKLKFWK